MIFSVVIFISAKKIQNSFNSFVFEDYFIILRSFSLLLFYCSANYFVVRELSIELMGLHFTEGEDIPFALLFYFLTAATPLFYVFYGIKNRLILWIRVGLICIAASVFTFKFYFSLYLRYHLKKLNHSGNGNIFLYWVNSLHAKITATGHGVIGLAGQAKTVDADLQGNVVYDARFLKTGVTNINTTDYARAKVIASEQLTAAAKGNSQILYYNNPKHLLKYNAESGVVLSLS